MVTVYHVVVWPSDNHFSVLYIQAYFSALAMLLYVCLDD